MGYVTGDEKDIEKDDKFIVICIESYVKECNSSTDIAYIYKIIETNGEKMNKILVKKNKKDIGLII